MSDFPNHVIYPAAKMTEVTDIEGLIELDRHITTAKERLAHYTRLSTLGILDNERLFYTNQEIRNGITHWQTTLDNMVRCWNSTLESMKIK